MLLTEYHEICLPLVFERKQNSQAWSAVLLIDSGRYILRHLVNNL